MQLELVYLLGRTAPWLAAAVGLIAALANPAPPDRRLATRVAAAGLGLWLAASVVQSTVYLYYVGKADLDVLTSDAYHVAQLSFQCAKALGIGALASAAAIGRLR